MTCQGEIHGTKLHPWCRGVEQEKRADTSAPAVGQEARSAAEGVLGCSSTGSIPVPGFLSLPSKNGH